MAITYDEISFIILLFGLLCLFIKRKKQIPGLRNIKIMALIVFIYNLSSAFMSLLTEAMWFSPDFSKACSYIHNCMFFTSCYYLPSFIGLIILDRCNAHHAKHWLFFLPPTLMEIFFFIVNSKTGRIFEISAVTTGYRHGSKFYHFVYDYGDLMWTTYILWALIVLHILFTLIRHRRRFGIFTMILFAIILVFETIMQYGQITNPNINLQSLAYSIGLTYLILVLFYIDDPYDDMTGLYNRRGFIRAAEDAVALSRGKMNMILVRDVINFQDVNERFGRDIGDEAIIGISRKLYEKYHNVAEIGYLGSDNFVLCLSDINYQANSDPNKLASYVQSELESDYEIEFSDGIYQIGDQKMDVLLMIDRAIYAHNKTKSNYNNHVSTFDQKMAEEFSMQSYINHNMKKALANKEFKVYFQPIYDSHSKKIISAEALVRWKSEEYGLINPGIFIPIFESNGFITELDMYVWNEVASYIGEWKTKGHKSYPCSVNISRLDFSIPNLDQVIIDIVKRNGIETSDLKLEVTESAFTSDDKSLLDNLNRLHNAGFKILMDDFGSGYSNFNTFSIMPVDILKADMKFLDNLDKSEKGKIIISSIMDMTDRLDMPIITEGVENEQQYNYLKSLKCVQIQGFYFSTPVPKEEFEKLLLENEL